MDPSAVENVHKKAPTLIIECYFWNLLHRLGANDDFRNRVQEDYHTGTSPLESIQLQMVSQIPLDYMHMICLGVTKNYCTSGSMDTKYHD